MFKGGYLDGQETQGTVDQMNKNHILPIERLHPPRLRRWLENLLSEVIWRYYLKTARWELEKVEEAVRIDLAARWRAVVVKLEDQLRALGVDPNKEPEDITKAFEVWLFAGLLVACGLFITVFLLYRQTLLEMILQRM